MGVKEVKRQLGIQNEPMVIYCRRESVKPGSVHGPVIRDVCVVECNLSGKGKIIINGQEFSFGPRDCYVLLPGDTVVSLNLWGLTRRFLEEAWAGFPAFLDGALAENPQKAEYYLPSVVSRLIGEGKARAKVLRSPDRWYGVTYQADKPAVVQAIADMTAAGVYPEDLWAEG